MRSEELHNYLAKNKIRWQFNLSKAPWWGGQYERIVGLVKQALFKVVGAASLKFQELREILLDVEISLNNRPLSYVEEDIQFPTLTPNIMLMGQNNAKIVLSVHLSVLARSILEVLFSKNHDINFSRGSCFRHTPPI